MVLDLVFMDDDLIVEGMEINSPLGKSDHACIVFQRDLDPQLKTKKKVYLYERGNYEIKREKLNINWEEYLKIWRKCGVDL